MGYYLQQKGYIANINLFVFNYPNEDAVIHNGKKLNRYILNLITEARINGNAQMLGSFFKTKDDLENNRYTIDLIGHSMGGLVSRYYIENLQQHTHVRRLITIDTPHWGSNLAIASDTTIGGILNMHKLCDHDLRPDAIIYNGGTANPTVVPASFGCTHSSKYAITPQLTNPKNRSTDYYAIAGLSYSAAINGKT